MFVKHLSINKQNGEDHVNNYGKHAAWDKDLPSPSDPFPHLAAKSM
jgi:hypothetical protein